MTMMLNHPPSKNLTSHRLERLLFFFSFYFLFFFFGSSPFLTLDRDVHIYLSSPLVFFSFGVVEARGVAAGEGSI
jgi:hypothetical protein